jgi:hypothetical protein
MMHSPAGSNPRRIVLAACTLALCAFLVGCQGFSSTKPNSQNSQPTSSPGDLAVSPTSVTFGNVQVGSSQSQTVNLSNSGQSDLTLSQATVSGSGFSISGLSLPLTLSVGQSATVNVIFNPAATGSATGTLTLVNDGSSSSVIVPLSGTGVAAGDLSGNPTSFSFGSVQIGTSPSQTETLTNTGGENLTITQASFTAAGFSYTGLTLPLTLVPGQISSFSVVFAPTTAGASNGVLSLTVSGSATTFDLAVSGLGVTPASLSTSPSTLNFGNVNLGLSQSLTETVNNSGGENLTITQATTTGTGFSYKGLNLPLTLVPGQSSTFSVAFAPLAAGSFSGTLSLTVSTSSTPVTVALSGTGIAPATLAASPASLTFSSVELGKSQTQTTTITNTGGVSATISQDTVSGSGFSISGLNAPLTLTPGQSATLSVTFTPQSLASVSGSVAIASDASNSNLTISLSGSATGAPEGQLSVSPGTINAGSVTVGQSGSATGTLSASGASVTVSSATVGSAEFTITGLSFPVVIPAGQSTSFSVTFTPQSSGVATSTASFVSNASNSPASATVTGTGVAAPVYSVSLSWNASSSPNISGYNVYRRTGASGSYVKLNGALVTPTSYLDTSVADGQTYYYETTAVNSSGEESAPSASVKAVIPAS